MLSTVDGAGDGSSGVRGLQNKTGLLVLGFFFFFFFFFLMIDVAYAVMVSY